MPSRRLKSRSVRGRRPGSASAPSVRRPRTTALGTRTEILHTALALFAEHGVGSVTLREILQQAGQGNQSAVQYYFSDKRGLVRAVADHVHQEFRPLVEETMAEIEQLDRTGKLRNEDLVGALLMPSIRMFHRDRTGRHAIAFMARLASEGSDEDQVLLMKNSAPFLNFIETRLAARLPRKSREKLRLQLLLSTSVTLFGLMTLGVLKHSPFGRQEPLYAGKREESIRDFLDFVCKGVLGGVTLS